MIVSLREVMIERLIEIGVWMVLEVEEAERGAVWREVW